MEKEWPSHKWISLETNLFCEILADLVNNFTETLWRGTLKRHSAVKYLISLLLNLKKMFSSKKKNQNTFFFLNFLFYYFFYSNIYTTFKRKKFTTTR